MTAAGGALMADLSTDILARLDARQETRWEFGLDRMRSHLQALGNPQAGLKIIHVAGTNGKGSVCALLESVLREAGFKTGLYTSPHLQEVRERIRLDGRPVPAREFSRALERALGDERLTYFETLTSAAFQIFAARKTDIVILETGLGGRLDATNVIEAPLASVITSIGLDHTQWLGKTLTAIAREKSGIVKPGSPVFLGACAEEVTSVVRRISVLRGSRFCSVPEIFRSVSVNWESGSQMIRSSNRENFQLGILGARQPANASLVKAVLDGLATEFKITKQAFRRGLALVRWPARFEVIRAGARTAVLDGAHNPQALAALLETLKTAPWKVSDCRFILGILKDKDAAAMVKLLSRAGLSDAVPVRPASPRALSARELAALIRRLAPKARVAAVSDPSSALQDWLRDPAAPKTAVVCGSLYLAGAARKFLLNTRSAQ